MTFTPLMNQIVKNLEFESVCEFGNQRYTGGEDFPSTRAYYESLGCKDYVALDVNEEMDAVIADLNEPVWPAVNRRFDLVTNNGTGEHIWNQHEVFRNAHVLSNRYILHVLPMIPWVNHGFFNYNPVLFRDLARANNYKETIYIANRWGEKAKLPASEMFKEKHPKQLEEAAQKLSEKGGVFVVAIFEKAYRTDPFHIPFQGKYDADIHDEDLKSKYAQRT
jgi:hypothetical protein